MRGRRVCCIRDEVESRGAAEMLQHPWLVARSRENADLRREIVDAGQEFRERDRTRVGLGLVECIDQQQDRPARLARVESLQWLGKRTIEALLVAERPEVDTVDRHPCEPGARRGRACLRGSDDLDSLGERGRQSRGESGYVRRELVGDALAEGLRTDVATRSLKEVGSHSCGTQALQLRARRGIPGLRAESADPRLDHALAGAGSSGQQEYALAAVAPPLEEPRQQPRATDESVHLVRESPGQGHAHLWPVDPLFRTESRLVAWLE